MTRIGRRGNAAGPVVIGARGPDVAGEHEDERQGNGHRRTRDIDREGQAAGVAGVQLVPQGDRRCR